MPSLTLSNSLGRTKDRVPVATLIDEHFVIGVGGFTEGAGLSAITNDGERLKVTSDATDGYATQSFTCTASTKYSYRITLDAHNVVGNKTVMIGTSAGDDSLVSKIVASAKEVSKGSFTTGVSTTTIHLGLKHATSGRTCYWDDILIETYD